MNRVILVGDSIRLGYQPYVVEQLEGKAAVSAPEPNGGTSENVLKNLEEWVLSKETDVVHLNAGLHDIKRAFGEEANNIAVDAYEKNVRTILESILEKGISLVIWALTTPVNEEWHHENKGFDRFEADVVRYNEAATRAASGLDVEIHNLYQFVMDQGRDGILRPDGVHFTPEGSALLGKKVAEFVTS